MLIASAPAFFSSFTIALKSCSCTICSDISSNIPMFSFVTFGSSFIVNSIPLPSKSVSPSKLLFKVISASFADEDVSFLLLLLLF